jgi:hypothetical protein
VKTKLFIAPGSVDHFDPERFTGYLAWVLA